MNPLLIMLACLVAGAVLAAIALGLGLDECRANLPFISSTLCDIASKRGWL